MTGKRGGGARARTAVRQPGHRIHLAQPREHQDGSPAPPPLVRAIHLRTSMPGGPSSRDRWQNRTVLYETPFGVLTQLYAGTIPEAASLNGKVGLLYRAAAWGTERLSSTSFPGHASVQRWRRHKTPSSARSFGTGSRSRSRTCDGNSTTCVSPRVCGSESKGAFY